MKIFAISDTHLARTNPDKDMSKFGENWRNHDQQIETSWKSMVGENDIVLIPGDISWASKPADGFAELDFFATLSGEKVFIKGNHDYWWESIKKVRSFAPSRMQFIQNNTVEFDDIAIAGTRLWDFDFVKWPCVARNMKLDEAAKEKTAIDPAWTEKMRNREMQRLKNSLAAIPKKVNYRIAMVHFPPINEEGNENLITDLMTKHNVDVCVFGHLHSVTGQPKGSDCVIGKTRYKLVSCDFLNFTPLNIC